MIIVVDTNVLVSALIRDSATRRVLMYSGMNFVCPEATALELRRNRGEILAKSGLAAPDFDFVFEMILGNVAIIPDRDIEACRREAEEIMSIIDIADAPFIAAALDIPDAIIWSDDKHFEKQKRVRVVKTEQILRMLFKG
ncbi:MAG: PIN domain-containing protein [Candidatus Aenigmarchaeota archaeon]|nr:PIN domain-containing protein [Candidatus Aenigmarchaeota archaeon]